MTHPPQGPSQPIGPGDPTTPAWPAAAPDQPTQHIPSAPGPTEPPTQYIPQAGPPSSPPPPQEPEESKGGFLRDPLSIVLSLVIVVALVIAGLLGVELYARHRADTVVAQAVECVVKDKANVSFGMRPFALQLLTKHFSDINVETAGNQIREAQGMKLNLALDDIKINKTAESAGTLGALDATITWSSDGIKKTLQDIIPIVGGMVSGVTTSPSDGTIELQGGIGNITAKPVVSNGSLNLEVISLSGLGFLLPRETVQPAFDAFTTALTKNLPMGIHADSVTVTDTGVTAKFVTRDATIPNGQQDPCFAGI